MHAIVMCCLMNEVSCPVLMMDEVPNVSSLFFLNFLVEIFITSLRFVGRTESKVKLKKLCLLKFFSCVVFW
jgi:hypothetical protein